MEGKYIWRYPYGIPFYAPSMDWVDRGRLYSLQISDYTFNTLLHQVHVTGHRFSAAELMSSSTQHLLSLNCDGAPTPTPTPKPTKPSARKSPYRGPPGKANGDRPAPKCLGSLFNNFTNFGPYSASDMGDIVFKSNHKAPAVYVDSDKRAFFDASGGVVEFFGPAQSGGYRSMLARADVRVLRGDFIPKLNKANITGTIKINSLELSQPQSNFRTMTAEWLVDVALFVAPVITESMSNFFDRYAQFPVPLPSKYECLSPQFLVTARTMQIDCDVQRVLSLRGTQCYCVSSMGACACED